ncbi:MAG: ACT domain-containing protein [Chloroflexi bacterium]|nr:ACT domain-containing protein [Chloroflexota bacterium]
MKTNLKLTILDGEYTIHRFLPEQDIPSSILKSGFLSITRTDDELSILCDANIPVDSEKNEDGWACIKVLGPLDFGLTGILARISGVLAEAKISIFAISTYDTDYVLVKKEKLSVAEKILTKSGYVFEG